MESTGEDNKVTLFDEIDIKEEPILTDPYCQPLEETEVIYIKEENVKMEIPEDHGARDPLQVETEFKDGGVSASCSSEPESNNSNGMEDNNRSEVNGSLVTRAGLPTGTRNAIQRNTEQEASSQHKSDTLYVLLSCNICKESFPNLQELKEHSHVDVLTFPYYCNVCHKTLTNTESLKIHFSLHMGERPYSCDVCHKTFRSRGGKIVHSRLHTGERPYSCDVCSKTFTNSSGQKAHSRIHTRKCPRAKLI